MTSLRQRIETHFRGCFAVRCEQEGCVLRIDRESGNLCTIVDCDAFKDSRAYPSKLCDYILFSWAKGLKVLVLEMKSGKTGSPADCLEQLQNGAGLIAEITTPREVPSCLPVLLHGSGSKSIEIKAIQQRGVRFRGKRLYVLIAKCGSSLNKLLGE